MTFIWLLLRSRYTWAVLCVAALGAVVWRDGYVRGSSAVQSKWNGEQARTAAGLLQKAGENDARSNVAAVRYEQQRETRGQAFRQIVRVVDRLPVPECRLSDDGLRQWNAVNSGGVESEAAGQPADGVPEDSAESAEREPAGSDGESH